MAWKRISTTTGPTERPVDPAELRDQLTLETDDDDSYLIALIDRAVSHVENFTHRRLLSQQVQMVLPDFPNRAIFLPLGKALSVQGISYYDTANALQSLSGPSDSPAGTSWQEDLSDDEDPILIPNVGADWPGVCVENVSPVTVSWTTGYGATGESVPAALRHAILMQATRWYEARWDGEAPLNVAPQFTDAVSPYKLIRYGS